MEAGRGCRRRGIRRGFRSRDAEPAGDDDPLLHGVRDEQQQALGDELRTQQHGAQHDHVQCEVGGEQVADQVDESVVGS